MRLKILGRGTGQARHWPPKQERLMNFELFIALRYLRAKRTQTFMSVISVFSVVGVALGVTSLIVAMAIMNGFATELRERILGATAQIVIYDDYEPMYNTGEFRDRLMQNPGVTNAAPFIYTELAISAPRGVKGVGVRGIDPHGGPSSVGMLEKLESGSLENLALSAGSEEERQMYGVIIGESLAKMLRVKVGDTVNLLVPSGRRTSAGVAPRVVPFTVAGTFNTGMVQYDTSLSYVSLEAAAMITGINDGRVSGFELVVDDVFRADKIGARLKEELGERYTIRTWMESNINVFAALKLEKFAMGIVLFLIILVASFSIVASLIMLVMEKTKDIAILMSMGATKKSIGKIFRLQGLIIGLVGASIGYALGLFLCFLLKNYKFIELPEGAYPMRYVPVLLQWQDLATIGVGAVVICFLATFYPAGKASGLVPSEALRSE